MTRNLEKQIVNCRYCNSSQTLLVDMQDVDRWEDGELIQDALPYLSKSERELLISGMCENCWGNWFFG